MITPEKEAVKAWYLVKCKAKQDERAEENLVRQGYTCFRPKRRYERKLRGQLQIASESLFPGYLFIQLSFLDSWGPLRSTRGVLRIVSFGGLPLSVRDVVIAQLRERDNVAVVASPLTQGERVRLAEGPFAELEAIFLAMDGEERVVLLMSFLEREQRVAVPLAGISRLF